ncbi:MAG: hypothetical protein R6V86_09965 [Spirochaetia bacterium]
MIRETYDKLGFRLVFGLVLSALLISSSLIVLADIEPQIYGIPLISMLGYSIGAVMGIGFLFAGIKNYFAGITKSRADYPVMGLDDQA